MVTGREDYPAHLNVTGRTAKTRVEEDFDGSLRAEDGGRLPGPDLSAVGFEGADRGRDGRRDLAGLAG